MSERQFPIMQVRLRPGQPSLEPFPLSIPWSVAELAYADYAARYGYDQSLERLAERGGFDPREMDQHLPGWRDVVNATKAAAKAEAINNIADVLALPTGSTAKDAVEGVRRLSEERDQLRADLCVATMEAESLPSQSALDQVIAQRDAALARVPQWIPCSERMPEEVGEYLCTLNNGDRMITWWAPEREHPGFWLRRVTHWMPLPAGPTP